jgi:GntR family transcriptional repressor for pyruvate dehydrogenase complex
MDNHPDTNGRRQPPLKTIKRIHLSREVKLQLEEAIRRGDYPPGHRLPSERELMKLLGVSRVSIREAIRSLEALGRVRVEHGRGAFVTDRRSAFGESMSSWLDQHQDELVELHGVRGALDVLAVQAAVAHFAADRIEEVVVAQATLARAIERGDEPDVLVELDIDFHLAIASASGNRLLYDLLTDLHVYLAEARLATFSQPDKAQRSREQHDEIVTALVAADIEAAGAAMKRHLASSTGAAATPALPTGT